MTCVRHLSSERHNKGLSFMGVSWETYSERQARLRNKRLGEDAGRSVPPQGLVTYVFSRHRCKSTALWIAAGLYIGADVVTASGVR